MKLRLALLSSLLGALFGAPAQIDLDRDPVAQLERLSKRRRQATVDELWPRLVERGSVPWRVGDEVRFLVRASEAERVAVAGDHTRWKPTAELERLEGTDLWWLAATFPADARIDYKLVVDDDWRLDPANPHAQRSGFGVNSELRMPGFEPSPWTAPREGPAPALEQRTLESEVLERTVTYRLHRPDPELAGDTPLAVLVVSDGHEYADDAMGALPLVADRLLAAGRMRPTLCVFVDPRDEQGRNRRASELGGSARFGRFVAEELLDALEAELGRTLPRDDVATLGTSLGGVASALTFAAARERVGAVGIHSPALWVAPGAAEAALLEGEARPARVFLSWGSVHDGAQAAETLADAIERAGVPLVTLATNQGHSWGQWSWVMDETLETLLPPR